MKLNRVRRTIEWSAEEKAQREAIREKFRHWQPTLEELLASGDYEGLVPFGEYYGLGVVVRELKRAREEAGLGLADVAKRSGIEKAAISRLENGRQPNPTIDTLYRYAAAIGKVLVLSIAEPPARPSRNVSENSKDKRSRTTKRRPSETVKSPHRV